MQGATEMLARVVANTRLEDIPDRVVQNAKLLILDTVGVTLAAARDSGCKLLAHWVKDQESAPRATVIGQGFRSSPLLAALVNGHAAHALDYDDSGHCSTQTLPAALALGEPAHVAGAPLNLANGARHVSMPPRRVSYRFFGLPSTTFSR